MKLHLKMSSGKWRPFCLALSMLIQINILSHLDCLSKRRSHALHPILHDGAVHICIQYYCYPARQSITLGTWRWNVMKNLSTETWRQSRWLLCSHWLHLRWSWSSRPPQVQPQTTKYRQVSNIRRTLPGNEFVDHSDAVGASPVGAAPTTSSFST